MNIYKVSSPLTLNFGFRTSIIYRLSPESQSILTEGLVRSGRCGHVVLHPWASRFLSGNFLVNNVVHRLTEV